MPDFSKRDTTPELMDIEVVDYESFRACLAETYTKRTNSRWPTGLRSLFFRRLDREERFPPGTTVSGYRRGQRLWRYGA